MKQLALEILLLTLTQFLTPVMAQADTNVPSKVQISFTVTNQKCIYSSTQVGLGDIVRLQILSIQPNGQAVAFTDNSLNVIWTVDSQATPYYPATKWSNIFPVNSPIEFAMVRGDSFEGQQLTISAKELVSGSNTSVYLTLVKSTLANCK